MNKTVRKSRTNLDYLVRIWIGEIELEDLPFSRQVRVMALSRRLGLGLTPDRHDPAELLYYFAVRAENGLRHTPMPIHINNQRG